MRISLILLLVAAFLMAVYLRLFYRQMADLSLDQRGLITTKSKPGPVTNTVVYISGLILIIAGNFYVALAGALYLSVAMYILSAIHKRSLRSLGFSEEFLAKREKLSRLAICAGFLAISSILLDKYLALGSD